MHHVVAFYKHYDLHSPGPGVNHFVPMWKVEKLSEDQRCKLLEVVNEEAKTLQAVLDLHQGGGILQQSLRETTSIRLETLSNWKEMGEWLWHGGGYVAAEVPADGDCSCWSLLALQKGNPFLKSNENRDECQRIRLEIASCWPKVKEDPMWQFLFSKLIQQIAVPAAEKQPDAAEKQPDAAEKQPDVAAAPVKLEPLPKKKTKKGNSIVVVDLTSPPRADQKNLNKKKKGQEPPADKRTVEVVGSQRAAMQVKKSKASPFEVAPIPQKKPAEKPTEEPKSLKEQLESVPDLDGSSKKKKLKKKKKQEEKDQEASEQETENAQQPRKRTCKTKEKGVGEILLEVVATYLSRKEITFGLHQRYHGTGVVRGSDQKCKQFGDFPNLFLGGKMPDCPSCARMLHKQGFVLEELQSLLKEAREDPNICAGKKRWEELQTEMRAQLQEDSEQVDENPTTSSCTDIVLAGEPGQIEADSFHFQNFQMFSLFIQWLNFKLFSWLGSRARARASSVCFWTYQRRARARARTQPRKKFKLFPIRTLADLVSYIFSLYNAHFSCWHVNESLVLLVIVTGDYINKISAYSRQQISFIQCLDMPWPCLTCFLCRRWGCCRRGREGRGCSGNHQDEQVPATSPTAHPRQESPCEMPGLQVAETAKRQNLRRPQRD